MRRSDFSGASLYDDLELNFDGVNRCMSRYYSFWPRLLDFMFSFGTTTGAALKPGLTREDAG